jgi:serine/threonine-protein kinase
MIGEKLGSFRIEAVLGTGAMGAVYRATNQATNEPAAVKVISGQIAKHSQAYERFRREADILQQFHHPNIVRFVGLGRYKGKDSVNTSTHGPRAHILSDDLLGWPRPH